MECDESPSTKAKATMIEQNGGVVVLVVEGVVGKWRESYSALSLLLAKELLPLANASLVSSSSMAF